MDVASNGVEDLPTKSFDQVSAQLKEDILKEKSEFETKIQQYKGNDPLDLRYKFINWINDKFPVTDRNCDRASSSYLIKVLEETLTLFKDDAKYTQDSRYVGLLIKYAELQPNPLELFQDIYNQGRGTACAILYYAWASQCEKIKDFKMANEIYQLGLNNKAEPLEDLRQVHMHMQLNVGRKVLGISESLPTTPCREALRKLQIDNQQCQRTSRLKDENKDKLSSPRVPGRIGGKENAGTVPKKLKQPQEIGSDYKQQFKKHRLRVGEPDNFTCPVFIPEPDDPIKVKMYPKHEVYAIEGKEFQLEEIYAMQMRHEKLKQRRLDAANHTSDESAIVQEGINYSSLGAIPKKFRSDDQNSSHTTGYTLNFKKHRIRVGEPDNFKCPVFIPDEVDDPTKIRMYPRHEVYPVEGCELQLEELMAARYEQAARNRQCVSESSNASSLVKTPNQNLGAGSNNSSNQGTPQALFGLEKMGSAGAMGPGVGIPGLQDSIVHNQSLTVATKEALHLVQGMWNSPSPISALKSHPQQLTETFKVPQLPKSGFQLYTDEQSFRGPSLVVDKPERQLQKFGSSSKKSSVPTRNENLTSDKKHKLKKKTTHSTVARRFGNDNEDEKGDLGVCQLDTDGNTREKVEKVNDFPVATRPIMVYTDEVERVESCVTTVSENTIGLLKPVTPNKITYEATRVSMITTTRKSHFVIECDNSINEARKDVDYVSDRCDDDGDDIRHVEPLTLPYVPSPPGGNNIEIFRDDEDGKENARPLTSQKKIVKEKRELSGILQPSLNIPSIPLLNQYKNANEFADETCNTQAFGFPTISSTPFINPTRNAIDTNTNQTDCDENTVAYCLSVTTEKVSKANAPTDLSIILEASKERYSSSSGSSSSGQTPFGVGTRLLKTATEAFSDVKGQPALYDITEENINDIEKRISSLNLGENIDPFSMDLLEKLLSHIKFPQKSHKIGYNVVNTNAPILRENSCLTLGKEKYETEKELGKGSYARVLKATHKGKSVALKYQKPSFVWEYYITREIRSRIGKSDKMNGFLTVNNIYVFNNASILETELGRYGSLIDVINANKLATGKPLKTTIATAMAIQLFSIVEHLHSCKIIHGDIKPDNFIICSLPTTSLSELSIKLIDFGRSIDMTLLPEGTTFTTVVTTDEFQCNEMKENRPWTYQTDYYGLAGTAYCLLVGDYMKVIKRSGEWTLRTLLPRYMNREVWQPIFQRLLNVESCSSLPELPVMRIALEDLLDSMGKAVFNNFNSLSSVLNKC